jgi:hypothetical protein
MDSASQSMLRVACLTIAAFTTLSATAAEYSCSVTKKVNADRQYSAEELAELRFSNTIEEVGNQTWVSRCSFARSAGGVTCDRLRMEHVVVDPSVKIKKYYMFSSQFDFQLYPDLSFVENNGRGGISYGRCRVVSP